MSPYAGEDDKCWVVSQHLYHAAHPLIIGVYLNSDDALEAVEQWNKHIQYDDDSGEPNYLIYLDEAPLNPAIPKEIITGWKATWHTWFKYPQGSPCCVLNRVAIPAEMFNPQQLAQLKAGDVLRFEQPVSRAVEWYALRRDSLQDTIRCEEPLLRII